MNQIVPAVDGVDQEGLKKSKLESLGRGSQSRTGRCERSGVDDV